MSVPIRRISSSEKSRRRTSDFFCRKSSRSRRGGADALIIPDCYFQARITPTPRIPSLRTTLAHAGHMYLRIVHGMDGHETETVSESVWWPDERNLGPSAVFIHSVYYYNITVMRDNRRFMFHSGILDKIYLSERALASSSLHQSAECDDDARYQ